MTTTASRPRVVRRGAAGWVPNQHGAWAMLVVPWLLGAAHMVRHDGDVVSALLLLVFWMAGYFAFFATSQWLRSRCKPRYRGAVFTYAAVTGALGVGLLVLRPEWWSWALVFSPLVVLSLWLSWRRRDRGLLSGATTVAAACLLPLVMGSQGVWPWTVPVELVGVALVCFGYFFGTVLYVKTLIRERGSRGWVAASVAWHVACLVAALALPDALPRVAVGVFFALMASRALVVPWLGPLRGRTVKAKDAGLGEFVSTAVLLVILLPAW